MVPECGATGNSQKLKKTVCPVCCTMWYALLPTFTFNCILFSGPLSFTVTSKAVIFTGIHVGTSNVPSVF